MRIICILCSFFLLISPLHAAERTYKSFENISDSEADAARVFITSDRIKNLMPPMDDYVEVKQAARNSFDNCKSLNSLLSMTQDYDGLVKSCSLAMSQGAADAGYILGRNLVEGFWVSPDYNKAIDFLEKASDMGSRSAKRYLVSFYLDPRSPIRDSQRSFQLAKSISDSGYDWDRLVYATQVAMNSEPEEALAAYAEIVDFARQGFQNASSIATLLKIAQGPLQDLEYARDLLDKGVEWINHELKFTQFMFHVMEGELDSARELLSDCYITTPRCGMSYVQFLSNGIGGPKDLEKAVEVLDFMLTRLGGEFANQYVWERSIAKETPLFNHLAARKVVSKIPDYKLNLPFIQDTIAAQYAAEGQFQKAIETQQKVVDSLEGKGLGRIYEGMIERLESYKQKRRWVTKNDAKTYIMRLKKIKNLTNMDAEIASL